MLLIQRVPSSLIIHPKWKNSLCKARWIIFYNQGNLLRGFPKIPNEMMPTELFACQNVRFQTEFLLWMKALYKICRTPNSCWKPRKYIINLISANTERQKVFRSNSSNRKNKTNTEHFTSTEQSEVICRTGMTVRVGANIFCRTPENFQPAWFWLIVISN